MAKGLNRLVVVSGLSGAGRTTAIKALEDIGFYIVDNLPTVFLHKFLDYLSGQNKKKLAVGISMQSDDEVREFL